MRRFWLLLVGLLILLPFGTMAREPAIAVAVDGNVTVHGVNSADRRSVRRGDEVSGDQVILVPKNGMVTLRFPDARGVEYSLESGQYTMARARRLARGERYSLMDRILSTLHVKMGEDVPPLDAAAYLPSFTRTDQSVINMIWPTEWFGPGDVSVQLSYEDGARPRLLSATEPVIEFVVERGLNVWKIEHSGNIKATARGIVQRTQNLPDSILVADRNGTVSERVAAARDEFFFRRAIRLARQTRGESGDLDLIFEASLAPRIPESLIETFGKRVRAVVSRRSSCLAAARYLVVGHDYVGVHRDDDPVLKDDTLDGASIYALVSNREQGDPWSAAGAIAGGLVFEREGPASAALASLWIDEPKTTIRELRAASASLVSVDSLACLEQG